MIAADSQAESIPVWVYEEKLACQQFKKRGIRLTRHHLLVLHLLSAFHRNLGLFVLNSERSITSLVTESSSFPYLAVCKTSARSCSSSIHRNPRALDIQARPVALYLEMVDLLSVKTVQHFRILRKSHSNINKSGTTPIAAILFLQLLRVVG
jgi:hypothetical protein